MKKLLTILICLFALNLTAQEVVVEYPYNPDFENDGNVGVEDLLQLLSSFGMAFEVGELTIDEVVLSEWLQAISETLVAQQALIDSLISNEANSGMGQLDSALIAEMINEAGSATASFGERVHLAEPADWGPLPWDDYVNYGTYAFDDQGIFMGFMKGPFFNIYVLNDSIEMEDISSSELETHSVVEITNGPDAFSIIVGTNERVIVRGMPNSFEYPETERNFDWIPVQSSNTIFTGNESEDQSQAIVGNASLGSSCRCWPDQGEIIVELPEADFVYLDVEPYLTGSGSSQYDSYNCFKFKLPDGPGFTTMTIIPPHIFNITPPVGSEGDQLDALQFEVYSSNFIGYLQYDGGIDNWSWGPHAGWHAWRFIRDHNGDWRPQTTQP